MTDIPDELVEKAAFALHDAECKDSCDPMVMGGYYRKARAVLEAVWPDLVSGEGVDPFSKVSNIDFDDDEESKRDE